MSDGLAGVLVVLVLWKAWSWLKEHRPIESEAAP
jgi:hypothetical protein